jgi:hypothetical protein
VRELRPEWRALAVSHASLLELVRYGTATLIGMAKDGEIRPMHLWTALKGAEKYRAAIVRGDLATAENAMWRRAKCGACPHATVREVEVSGKIVTARYCGPAFECHLGPEFTHQTCGCLVGLTIDGESFPGGMTLVGTEQCPQGRWEDVA